MKKYTLSLLILCLCSELKAQNIEWVKTLPVPTRDRTSEGMLVDKNGNSSTYGHYRYCQVCSAFDILGYDATGNGGGGASDDLNDDGGKINISYNDAAIDNLGDIFVVYTIFINNGNHIPIIYGNDTVGNYNHTFIAKRGSTDSWALDSIYGAIDADYSGNLYIGTSTHIIKYDINKNLLFSVPGPSGITDIGGSTSGYTYVLTVSAVYKYDLIGTLINTAPYGGNRLKVSGSGNVFLSTGSTLRKLDGNLNPVWYNSNITSSSFTVDNEDASYLINGYTVTKIDTGGSNTIWTESLADANTGTVSDNYHFTGVGVDDNKNVYVSGNYDASPVDSYDALFCPFKLETVASTHDQHQAFISKINQKTFAANSVFTSGLLCPDSGSTITLSVDTGALVTTNNAGHALSFNGVDSYVEGDVGDAPIGFDSRTIEAWIKPGSTQTGTVFSYGGSNNATYNYSCELKYKNQHLYFSASGNDLEGNITINTGVWTHVAITYNGTDSIMKLYVNGVLDVSSTIVALHTIGLHFRMGRSVTSSSIVDPFSGQADEIRIWNYAKSQSEIAVNMNTNVSNSSSLRVYFKLDEGSGLPACSKDPFNNFSNVNSNTSWVNSTAPISTSNILYSWSTGATSASINVNAAGTYSVTITYTNGCPVYSPSITIVKETTPCIIPYVTTPASGSVNKPLGSELTQFAKDTVLNVSNIFVIDKTGSQQTIVIDVIPKPGKYTTLKNKLITYGMTGISNPGNDSVTITGKFPIYKLPALDSLPSLIKYVRPFFQPMLNVKDGVVKSRGEVSIKSDLAKLGWKVDGTGVRVGVISDSYNKLGGAATNVLNGDLPGGTGTVNTDSVIVVQENSLGGGTDEGRAMLQIIHDVAPKAKLYFRTGFNNAEDFAKGILDLQKKDSCTIIVDDVTYPTESFFRDGVIAQAVDSVKKLGVSYFSSAGNFGNKSYEGIFHGVTPNAAYIPDSVTALKVHNFNFGSSPVDYFQNLILPAGDYFIVLQWKDSSYSLNNSTGAKNDLDFYILSDLGNPGQDTLICGFNRNNIGYDPYEILSFTVKGDSKGKLLIARNGGSTVNLPFKYIFFKSPDSFQITEYNTSASTIVGQANASGAITVGAVRYSDSPNSSLTVESFSSTGGSINGVDRHKPDITAPDGVNTTVDFGSKNIDNDFFPNFFGSSCAAPHAAAVGALLANAKQKFYSNAKLSPDSMRTILDTSAIDLYNPGYDVFSGKGFIQADAALSFLADPAPILTSYLNTNVLDTIGTDTVVLNLYGNYFKTNSTVRFNQNTIIPTGTPTSTIMTVKIPPFTGNPYLSAYNPPSILVNGLDGGFSDSIRIPQLPEVKVVANFQTKKYGEKIPDFTFTITIDKVPLDSTGISLDSLGLTDLASLTTTTATSTSGVDYYLIETKSNVTDLSIPKNLALSEKYRYTFLNGSLLVTKMPLVITPRDTIVTYGDKIQSIGFNYNYDTTNIALSERDAFYNSIKSAHHDSLVDEIAVCKGSFTKAHLDSLGFGFMSSERAIANGPKLVNTADISDPIGTVNLASSLISNYDSVATSFTLVNGTSLVNCRKLVNGSAFLNNRKLVNSRKLVNASTVSLSTNKNLVSIIDTSDFAASYPDLLNFKPINLITGLNASNRFIIPGAFISENFDVSYKTGKMTIVKAMLTDSAVNKISCSGVQPAYTSNFSGYKYSDSTASVILSGPVYTVYDGSVLVGTGTLAAGNYQIRPSSLQFKTPINYSPVYVDGVLTVGVPSVPAAINGPSGACWNQTGVIFSVDPVANATSYVWTLPAGATGTSTTSSISVNFSSSFNGGQIRVKSKNNCGSSANISKTISHYSSLPAVPSGITGLHFICQPTFSAAYDVSPVNNASSYNWTIAGNGAHIIGGQGSTSLSVRFDYGFVYCTISVQAVNCIGSSNPVSVSVLGAMLVAPSFTITNNQTNGVCGGSTHDYSINKLANAVTYSWSAPTGCIISNGLGLTGNPIVVDSSVSLVSITFPGGYSSGNVSIYASNGCGNSPAATLTVKSKPNKPGAISGPVTNNCNVTGKVYSITAVTGAASYTWTVPSGATIVGSSNGTSITVNYGAGFTGTGNITVKANNACGSSAATILVVSAAPAQPGTISGNGSPCKSNASANYSIAAVAGAISYTWTMTGGAMFVGGTSGTSVTLNYNSATATTATLSVKSNNNCGSSIVKSRTINVNLGCRTIEEVTISDQDNSIFLNAVPNPTSGKLTVVFSTATEGKYSLSVIDLFGRAVLNEDYSATEGMNLTDFDLRSFASGIYFLQLKKEGIKVKTIRIVLSK